MALLPIQVLREQRLLTWAALVVGFNYKWATRDDIVQFAVNWLVEHPLDDEQSVVLLAGSENETDEKVLEWLCQAARSKEGFIIDDQSRYDVEMGRWRYAHLVALDQSPLSNNEKLDALQKIYADFGYPQDMALCSKYGPSQFAIDAGHVLPSGVTDALETMRTVIAALRAIYTSG
jgi:hypothetical protein